MEYKCSDLKKGDIVELHNMQYYYVHRVCPIKILVQPMDELEENIDVPGYKHFTPFCGICMNSRCSNIHMSKSKHYVKPSSICSIWDGKIIVRKELI